MSVDLTKSAPHGAKETEPQAAAREGEPQAGGRTAPFGEPQKPDSPEPGLPPPPGLVAVQGGKVVVRIPHPESARPSIAPGAHVSLVVNGRPVTESTAVDAGDEVVVEAVPEPPQVEVLVEVTQGGLEAVARVSRRPGVRYRINDAPFAPQVTISATPVGRIDPPPLAREQVLEALAKAGVVYGIDGAAIDAMTCREELEFSAVVARGKPPSDPVDAHVEPVAPQKSEAASPKRDDVQRVDLLDRGEVLSVREGEVVAVWVEARPGEDGVDVRGAPIPARKPKLRPLKLGSGAVRPEGSREILAARTGRPVIRENFVDVVPSYHVPGDVNVATGHVEFAGDVTVQRNVEESLRVRAGGSVIIGGMVLRKARVEAGGSVRVKSVVGGSISAGENAALYGPLIDRLKRLAPLTQQALESLRRLAAASQASGRAVQLGVFFKALLERHYGEAQKLAQEIGRLAAEHKNALEPELAARIAAAAQMLVGRGPLLVRSLDEIEQAIDEMLDAAVALESRLSEADVIVEYLQNAEVACGGRVRLVGKACYNSKVVARTGFEARAATIRGGSVAVTHGGVVAREIGSPSAVVTEISVAEHAAIEAEVIHPNVRCTVGHRQYRFEQTRRHIVLRLDRETGELRF